MPPEIKELVALSTAMLVLPSCFDETWYRIRCFAQLESTGVICFFAPKTNDRLHRGLAGETNFFCAQASHDSEAEPSAGLPGVSHV